MQPLIGSSVNARAVVANPGLLGVGDKNTARIQVTHLFVPFICPWRPVVIDINQSTVLDVEVAGAIGVATGEISGNQCNLVADGRGVDAGDANFGGDGAVMGIED